MWSCQCPERAARALTDYRAQLDAIKAGTAPKHLSDGTIRGKRAVVKDLRRMIAREEARLAEGHHAADDPDCGTIHGYAGECPVCCNGEERVVGMAANLLSIVRDLRAALGARGLL